MQHVVDCTVLLCKSFHPLSWLQASWPRVQSSAPSLCSFNSSRLYFTVIFVPFLFFRLFLPYLTKHPPVSFLPWNSSLVQSVVGGWPALSVPELLCHLLGHCVGLGAHLGAKARETQHSVTLCWEKSKRLPGGRVQWCVEILVSIKMSSITLAQPQGRVDLIWPQHHADIVAWIHFCLSCWCYFAPWTVAWGGPAGCVWVFSAKWSSSSSGNTCSDCFHFQGCFLLNQQTCKSITSIAGNRIGKISWSPACLS